MSSFSKKDKDISSILARAILSEELQSLGTMGKTSKKVGGTLGSMGVTPGKIRTSTRRVRKDKGIRRGFKF